jgi:hypothetical protein
MKNAPTHNFPIYDPTSMNKKNQRYGFSSATKQPQSIFFLALSSIANDSQLFF